MIPALDRGAPALAVAIADVLPACADLIRAGHRVAAPAIVEALRGTRYGVLGSLATRDLRVEQVQAWGAHDDEALCRSQFAHERANGCEDCALIALRGEPAPCSFCAENGAES